MERLVVESLQYLQTIFVKLINPTLRVVGFSSAQNLKAEKNMCANDHPFPPIFHSEIHQILILGLPNSFPHAVWGFMARLAAGRKRRGTRRRGTRTWWGRDAPTTAFAPAEIFPVYRQVIPSHSKSS